MRVTRIVEPSNIVFMLGIVPIVDGFVKGVVIRTDHAGAKNSNH
jgi:hypothetical protein